MTVSQLDPRVTAYLEAMPRWRPEFAILRGILAKTGLEEDLKWAKPCYTHGGVNVVIFQPFKPLCALLYFRGRLLDDPQEALREQGENTRSAMRFEFRSVGEVAAAEQIIIDLTRDAMRVAEAGLSLPERDATDEGPYPDELSARLDLDAGLRDAWQRLTPGRRRGWLLHFNGAKQSRTRDARIERALPRIFEGFGMHD